MRLLLLLTLAVLPAAAQSVTATKTVEIDGKMQTVRKINRRWWSPDNRELRQTSAGFLWTISGGSGQKLVRFNHHRPVNRANVALLTRSMGPVSVRALLGEPNRIFPYDQPENHQHWDYYGSDGYHISMMFSSYEEGIFTAREELTATAESQEIEHLAFRPKFASRSDNTPATILVPQAAQPAAPAAPIRRTPESALASVAPGMERGAVLTKLGSPAGRTSISGGDGILETLTYYDETSSPVRVKLTAGKVVAVQR